MKEWTEEITVIFHDNGTWLISKELFNNEREGAHLTALSFRTSIESWSDPGDLRDLSFVRG